MAGINYGLSIHKEALAQLAELAKTRLKVRTEIAVFLEELQNDQDRLDLISKEGHEDERMTVKMVQELQKEGINVWRLAVFEVSPPQDKLPYRLLIAFDAPKRMYYVVGIYPRGISYDKRTLQNVARIYQELGIARLPR